MNEEKLGYLIAKVEEQGSDLKGLMIQVNALEKRVEDKLRTAELVFRFVKFSGLAALAVLTFKFGDVKALWLALTS
jgi:hypothetical protein